MNYADYYDCDICNGNSVGMSLFVSGCPIHCEGCFNSNIWDFNSGKEWTPDTEEKFIKLAGRNYIKRISFLGGSPLCDHNIKDVALLIQHLKHDYPDKQIWVYTGYTWESIITPDNNTLYDRYRREVLDFIDVLVDGPFIYDERDLTLAFRGSKNQRIIDVKKSLAENKVVLYDQR
jgi:anaerobic ribonucleoside-triphosphate reductase activating protein